MSQSIKGTIEQVFDTQPFTSGFSKREFLVKTDEQYPQVIKL